MAIVAIIVITDLEMLDIQYRPQMAIHGLDSLPRLGSSCHVGLIGNNHHQKPGCLERADRLGDPWQDLDLAERLRRIGLAILDHRAVYDPVSIKENSRPRYRAADSHLV